MENNYKPANSSKLRRRSSDDVKSQRPNGKRQSSSTYVGSENSEDRKRSSEVDTAGSDEEKDVKKPKNLQFWITFLNICFGSFFSGYDANVVATITPVISDEFGALTDLSWYGIAYSLSSCAMLFSYGKLYSYFPMKWVYTSALTIFLAGGIVCATAQSSNALIIGRAIAGLGCAGMLSGGSIMLSKITTLRERALYGSIVGGLEVLALAGAPIIAGVIAEKVTWRVVFYIIIPFNVASILATVFFVDITNTTEQASLSLKEKIEKMDLPGAALFVPLIMCLVLALELGGSQYEWTNWRIILLFALFGVLLIVYTYQQYRAGDNATISMKMLSNRTVACGMLYMFTISGALYLFSYFTPVFYQAIQGSSTLDSGLRDLPRMLGLVIALLLAGVFTTAVGYYTPTMILGSIMMSVGAGLTTTWHVNTGLWPILGYNLIFGLGCGFGFQQCFLGVQTVLPQADVPTGIVILEVAQFLGNIVVLAVSQTVFTNKFKSGLQKSVPDLNPDAVLGIGALNLRPPWIDEAYVPAVLSVYADSLDKVYYIGLALAVTTTIGALGMKWESVKKNEEKEQAEEKDEATNDEVKVGSDMESGPPVPRSRTSTRTSTWNPQLPKPTYDTVPRLSLRVSSWGLQWENGAPGAC